MINVIACGVDQGTEKKYRCPCCGMESDDIERFATSSCWACAFAMNVTCANCIKFGVGINHFRAPRAKLHRLRVMFDTAVMPVETALTMCGFKIPRLEMGQATAASLPECKRCWPEGRWA